jgi:hypothetical protein
MALRIRNNKDIKGFQIKIDEQTHSIKISQLADDTTLYFNSKNDTKCFKVVKINVHSSESNAFFKSTKTIAPSTL